MKKIVSMLLFVILLATIIAPNSVAYPNCPPHTFYAYYCEAAHPHANFNYCYCGHREYDGTTRYKSNCAICNPQPCQHTGSTWTDPAHPHATYCQQCSAVLSSSGFTYSCSTCHPTHTFVGTTCGTYGTCACGATQPPLGHYYDDCADSICNRCYASRIAPGHSYIGPPNYVQQHPHNATVNCTVCGTPFIIPYTGLWEGCSICNTPPDSLFLPIDTVGQSPYQYLCWAAVSEAVIKYISGETVTKTELAIEEFGSLSDQGYPLFDDVFYSGNDVQSLMLSHSISSVFFTGPLTFDVVKNTISGVGNFGVNSPVMVNMSSDLISHCVYIKGYTSTQICYGDPAGNGSSDFAPYELFKSIGFYSFGGLYYGSWGRSLYNFQEN